MSAPARQDGDQDTSNPGKNSNEGDNTNGAGDASQRKQQDNID